MKINTKVVFEWNDESKQYEEISCESYDYAGDISECQDYNYPLIYPELQGIGNFDIPSLLDEETEQYLNQSSSGGLLGQPQTLNLSPPSDSQKIDMNALSADINQGGFNESSSTDVSGNVIQQNQNITKKTPNVPIYIETETTDVDSANSSGKNAKPNLGAVEVESDIAETGEKKPWGGLLGKDTKIGKSIGAFGKKGGLLGMAMKGMGVEGAGDIMNQFSGAMNKAMGANKQEPLNQQDYISDVQSAANVSAPTYQRQEGSFY